MNTSLGTYSSLEALLLFQALAAYGTYADVFERISDSLKTCYLTVDGSKQDPDRFRPDAIRDFCLRLLNENVAPGAAGAGVDGYVNGEGGSSPKKRKIGSPRLKTIEDASREGYLIPQTVAKLYARYQQQAVEEIRRDEALYDTLVKQEEDDKAEKLTAAAGLQRQQDVQESSNEPSRAGNESIRNARETISIPREAPSQPKPVVSKPAVSEDSESDVSSKQSGSATPSLPLEPHEEPVSVPPPANSDAQKAFASQQNQPAQTSVPPTSQPRRQLSPSRSPTTQASSSAPSRNSTPSAHSQQQVPPSSVQSYPPRFPLKTSANTSANPQPSSAYPSTVPAPINQQHARPVYPPPHAAQTTSTVLPPRGGIQLPPFQLTTQVPSAQPSLQRQSSATPRSLQPRVSAAPVTPAVPALATPPAVHSPGPISALRNRERPGRRLSPGSQTAFKISVPKQSVAVSKPQPGEVSPITDEAPKAIATSARGRSRPPPPKTRGSSRHQSKTPSVSATSSRDATRSQSIVSETEADIEPEPERAPAMSTRRATQRKSKARPPTPALTADEDPSDSAPSVAARPRGRTQSIKRKRADSIADVSKDEADKDDLAPSSPGSPPTSRQKPPRLHDAGVVVAQKNFNKISAPIMNNILMHKYAGVFQNPVKERDAPGYSSIIKRAQDLKSIKNAITAGSRAVIALTSDAGPNSPAPTPSSLTSTSTVTLPWSEDIVPPKGIVNSAQLEAELLRIFANAVMFNHPGDPVLADTLDMAENVMSMVTQWRAGGGSGEDGIGEEDGGGTPVGKKRRL